MSAPTSKPDPLLALITAYRNGLAIYNASKGLSQKEDEALRKATWELHYDHLCTAPPAATTMEGAIAAVRLVAWEEETCGHQDSLTINVLKAGLAFFDQDPRHEGQPYDAIVGLPAEASRRLSPHSSAIIDATMDAAIAACKRTQPRDEDDPWWDGYDGAMADCRHELDALRDELLAADHLAGTRPKTPTAQGVDGEDHAGRNSASHQPLAPAERLPAGASRRLPTRITVPICWALIAISGFALAAAARVDPQLRRDREGRR